MGAALLPASVLDGLTSGRRVRRLSLKEDLRRSVTLLCGRERSAPLRRLIGLAERYTETRRAAG